MTTTYHLLQWLSQYTSRVFGKISFSFSAKSKIIQQTEEKKWSLNFQKNQNLKILLLCTAQHYNLAISHVILSQIFDNAGNAFSILSNQYTGNLSCIFYGSESCRGFPRKTE